MVNGYCYCHVYGGKCKTIEADVIASYISFLLADVVANVFVADVITTCYSMRRCLLMADVTAIYIYLW